MLVRFTQDVNPTAGTRFEAGRLYDLDPKIANAYITQGLAVGGDAVNADKSGTPGNATVNTFMGKAAVAAGAASVVVTNALCKATSIVQVQLEQNDATLTKVWVSAVANGSFTVTGPANATAATRFNFTVTNP
jgi:hypothetical protein